MSDDHTEQLCKVNGCPLPPDFVTDWTEDGRPKWGICRYHRLTEPADWPHVTRRIERYRDELDLVKRIDTIRNPILLPLPGETVKVWLQRVDDNLRRIMVGELENQELDFGECYRAIYGGKK